MMDEPADASRRTPTREEVEPYLPNLARSTAGGLTLRTRVWLRGGAHMDLAKETPVEEHRLAAVLLVARALSRRSWEKVAEVSEQQIERMSFDAPPPPADMTPGQHTRLAEVLDATPRACSSCATKPGERLCTACGGTGRDVQGSGMSCPVCGGVPLGRCSTCDGTARTVRARVRHIEDQVLAVRYAYVPTMLPTIEAAIDQAIDPALEPPEVLRFDPDARVSGGPYRDSRKQEPVFYGHRFGDALTRALQVAKGLGGEGEILRQDIKTYAWPILWLRYRFWGVSREVALVPRRDGAMFAFVTK
jgi:hypothetical protein